MATARDRCAGVLLGLAAGDKNGGPIRMAVLLAESMISSHSFNLDHVVETYNKWFLGKDSEKCFDTGGTFFGVFKHMKTGMTNQAAAKKIYDNDPINAGVNAAHRSVPIAMSHFITDVLSTTEQEARITHLNPISTHVAQAVNTIIRELIKGCKWTEAIATAKLIPGITEQVVSALNGSSVTDGGGFAPSVLQDAIYFVNNNETDAHKAIAASLKYAGPSNFCPVLVGAFCGALVGRSGIMKTAKHELHDTSGTMLLRLSSAADALALDWPDK